MKIANLFEDMQILKEVQKLVSSIMSEDSKLEQEKNQRLKKLIASKFSDRIEI